MGREGSGHNRKAGSVQLTTAGVTLLGVMLSVGATVGFGLAGPWWIRMLAGVATTIALVLVVKLGTRSGRGPVARAANWVIGPADSSAEQPQEAAQRRQ